MKIIFIRVFVLALLLLNSCGFFRSIGLYSVPPDYADTFEEIKGIKFINHFNKTSNLVLDLTTTQNVFSPYDSIKIKYKISNLSQTDTMHINSIHPYYYYTDLFITDTLNKRINPIEWSRDRGIQIIDEDEYGRRIKPILALNGARLPPMDSITGIISFKIGSMIVPKVYSTYARFESENVPGKYYVYYVLKHEEYDNIKGPITTKLISDTVEYFVRNLTEEELLIKNEATQIVQIIDVGKNFEMADSLLLNFNNKYPKNYYYSSLVKFLEAKKELNR
ncbi:MAG TPA: hypothetical protein DHV28_05570 [Ignavibacteriales bacterium]|nr:hypothetical protein [Ignavibacteriales bacterium]